MTKSKSKKPQKTAKKTAGNKGGDCPPDVVRKRALASFEKLVPILEQIADDKLGKDGERPSVQDRIAAIAALGNIGLGCNMWVEVS